MNLRRSFVFAVVGARHVRGVDVALRFLKRVTRHEILVLQSRSNDRPAHDQVMEVALPPELDDHQASIYLKTNLLEHVRGFGDRFCYLDSDVIAVDADVDQVFGALPGPIAFAQDHAEIDRFSSWAVNCGCTEPGCNHLREALLCTFGIDVHACNWRLWNGGVFVFDERAEEFFSTWHSLCTRALRDPYWRTRDQGALAGTVWKLGMEGAPTLPAAFNFIVDCMRGRPLSQRAHLPPEESFVRADYVLGSKTAPHFIHFVNGGVERRGWKNWDDVERLLEMERAA